MDKGGSSYIYLTIPEAVDGEMMSILASRGFYHSTISLVKENYMDTQLVVLSITSPF